MFDTINRYLQGLADNKDTRFLRIILMPLGDRYSSQPLSSAGLVINGAGATFPKIGAAPFYASVTGRLVSLAAGTALPAPTGINIGAGAFNVACYFVDAAGTVTVLGGTQGASLVAVQFPQFPLNKALVGFLIITNAGAFTGGTTPLDTATTVYVNPVGAFDPTVLT